MMRKIACNTSEDERESIRLTRRAKMQFQDIRENLISMEDDLIDLRVSIQNYLIAHSDSEQFNEMKHLYYRVEEIRQAIHDINV